MVIKKPANRRSWSSVFVFALALFLCAASGMAAGAEETTLFSETRQIKVRGEAIHTVTPDTVDIIIGITSQNKTEQEALNYANTVIGNVKASLKSLNITEHQMKTTGVNVTPNYENTTRRHNAYNASLSFSVKIMDYALIDTVVDAAVAQGANNIESIRLSSSQEKVVYRKALSDAIIDAREKAEMMAEAAGVQLGQLLLLQEGRDNTYPYPYLYSSTNTNVSEVEVSGSGMSNTRIVSGEIQISASVDLIYETK